MPTRHSSHRLSWILATPLAVLMAWPVGAADLKPKREDDRLGTALAQLPAPTEQPIPADITALEETAQGLYERGAYQQALEVMQKVMVWVAGHLPRLHPYRARSQTWMGLMLSKVGRRQEALAPTEEALNIYRELAKTNPAVLPDLAWAMNNLGVRLSNLGRRQEALAPTEEALRIYRELAKTNPAFLPDLARALTSLGFIQFQLDQPEIARNAYEESIDILRPLAASNPAFQDDLQRSLNNLENLKRAEGIRTGAEKPLAAENISYLPKGDPLTPVKRSVVRLLPEFAGGSGLRGTGFVVKRQGNRAWIATALHVVRDPKTFAVANKVEAEIYTGPLPIGVLPPRLEVVLPPVASLRAVGDDLIILEIRGLPADVQSLPLSQALPDGVLLMVGHYPSDNPWNVIPMSYLEPLTEPSGDLKFAGVVDSGASGAPVLNGSREVVGVVSTSADVDNPTKKVISAFRARLLREIMP
ncbi:MAG: tetratricopeptide repeat protein [Cyanobacteriota bacterium]|nr:tetratricopeptide repeat protein [Cyanobacteriota bacterium]